MEKSEKQTETHRIFTVYMHYTNADGNILLIKSSKILSNTE